MKEEKIFDNIITKAMYEESNRIAASKDLKLTIDERIENMSRIVCREEVEAMRKKRNIIRTAVAAAIGCFLIPAGVFAAGKVTGYISVSKAGGGYESFEDKGKVEEEAGFNFQAVKQFQNGYTFRDMGCLEVGKVDESNSKVGSFNQVSVTYQKDSEKRISLDIHPIQEEEEILDFPTEDREIKGVKVTYYEYQYRFVNEDYEVTPEDEIKMKEENYYISYGDFDEPIDSNMQSVIWEKDGIGYNILAMDLGLEMDEMFQMAEEVLAEE